MKKFILTSSTIISALYCHASDDWDISKLDASKLPPAADKKDVTFEKDIKPIFEASCFRCHGSEKQKGELRLDSLEAALKGGEDGKMIVPKDSAKSLLVFAVAQVKDEIAMPPKRRPGGPGGPAALGPGSKRDNAAGEKRPSGDSASATNRPAGPGGPGGRAGGPGGPSKVLTKEQVGLVRAWIDQGAK